MKFLTNVEELLYGCIKSILLSNEYNLMPISLFGDENIIKDSQKWKYESLSETMIFDLRLFEYESW